jgi:hypothetical protein
MGIGSIGIKELLAVVTNYVGTKEAGALPLTPAVGIKIQGSPPLTVNLFPAVGGIFPKLSESAGEFLTSSFNKLATESKLNPNNLFMSSPLGSLVKNLSNLVDFAISNLTLSADIGLNASRSQFNAVAGALQSTTDQLMGMPTSSWTSLDPANITISPGAQILNPSSLVSNVKGTLINSVAIEECTKQVTSTVFLDAAKAELTDIVNKIPQAATQAAKDLLGNQLKTTLTTYTGRLTDQLASFEKTADEIGKNLNSVAVMAAQVVPPSINVKGSEVLVSAVKDTSKYTPDQIVATTSIAARMNAAVLPIFKTDVLPVIDNTLALEANTSKTSTDRLATATADIKYDRTGYPEGVNVRYDG